MDSNQSKAKAKAKAQAPGPVPTSSRPTAPRRQIAFISGPLEANEEYFNMHYLPKLRDAVDKGHLFIIGPSRGIDSLSFDYLRKSGVPASRIRLYLNTSEETRLSRHFKRFEEVGGALVIVKGSHTERDEAMTRASHYDILRYRTEEECRALYGASYRPRISGTQKNEIRRNAGIGLVWPDPGNKPVGRLPTKDSKA
ncbi:hypothetical protein GALMADRAFT_78069 [Galerina marginata CBS 339.88]|uniref:Uncharacterized protein n=1 Tax=Galerina marginata (strain CBS 339.88) TaxID=685588 RepID=A0A067SD08_GALM3|nr:hypothetical protein GALMADRAFT_78069 [Galerina marginata CBS 339.88]